MFLPTALLVRWAKQGVSGEGMMQNFNVKGDSRDPIACAHSHGCWRISVQVTITLSLFIWHKWFLLVGCRAQDSSSSASITFSAIWYASLLLDWLRKSKIEIKSWQKLYASKVYHMILQKKNLSHLFNCLIVLILTSWDHSGAGDTRAAASVASLGSWRSSPGATCLCSWGIFNYNKKKREPALQKTLKQLPVSAPSD